MKVIILCAGIGSRLRPHTDKNPKCMVKFQDTSLLHWQIKALNLNGLNDLTLIGGYKHEMLRCYNCKIIVNHEYKNTNMLYSLLCAKNILTSGEDILISYGDIIYEPNLIKNFLENSSNISIAADPEWLNLWSYRFNEPLDDAETFKANDEGELLEIGNKARNLNDIQAQYRGLIKISSIYIDKFLNLCETYRAEFNDNAFKNLSMTEFLMYLINKNEKIEASFYPGGWLEFDNKSDLDLYNNLHKNKTLGTLFKIDQLI